MKTQVLLSAFAASAMVAGSASAATLDISGSYNADAFATSATDDSGLSFGEFGGDRGEDYKFRTDLGATPALPASGGTFTASNSGIDFQLGDYSADNTVMLEAVDSVTIDISDQVITELYVLHSAVFLGSAINGTVVFNYTDSSTSAAQVWDLRDWLGAAGADPVALVAPLDNLNGAQLFQPPGFSPSMYTGTIVNPEAGKTVASITFATNLTDDADADIAIFALSAVPEPGSLALMGLGGLCVLRRRRA